MYHRRMRTTIEMKPEHRAKLLELAARRGEKGFSGLVEEALESYFTSVAEQDNARRRSLRLRGSFSKSEGQRLQQAVAAIRERWR